MAPTVVRVSTAPAALMRAITRGPLVELGVVVPTGMPYPPSTT